MDEKFINNIINEKYILWLKNYTLDNPIVDDLYFLYNNNVDEIDLEFINDLLGLFNLIIEYKIINNLNNGDFFNHIMTYDEVSFLINYDGECYSCKRLQKDIDISMMSVIKYEQLRKYVLFKYNNIKTLKKSYKFD